MDKIQVQIVNPKAIEEAEKMAVAMARLTQRGATVTNMDDFEELIEMPYTDNLVEMLCSMPHPTLQKFGLVNIAVIGASRRFLAQITRHQNEVKFMSGSLQYSDYSGRAQFCVPYEIMEATSEQRYICDAPATAYYLEGCMRDLQEYEELAKVVGHDAAGYNDDTGAGNNDTTVPYFLQAWDG
jgi:thymidylate synthase (FAD)